MASYRISHKRSIFSSVSVTTALIISNVITFILFTLLVSGKAIPLDAIALNPSNILHGRNLWTLVTSMFMHGNFEHLFFNMISLFFVGTLLERIIGRKRYFWFYMISGIFAGLVFSSLAYFLGNSALGASIFGSPDVLGVGASGALFGLVGVLAFLIPEKKISLIAGPLIAIILESFLADAFPGSASVAILSFLLTIYIFFSIFVIFSFNPRLIRFSVPITMPFWLLPFVAIIPLVVAGLFVSLPIANSAHFGGLIAGLIYGAYLRDKYKRKIQYLNRYLN